MIVDDLAELAPTLERVGVDIVLLAAGDRDVVGAALERSKLACRLLMQGGREILFRMVILLQREVGISAVGMRGRSQGGGGNLRLNYHRIAVQRGLIVLIRDARAVDKGIRHRGGIDRERYHMVRGHE